MNSASLPDTLILASSSKYRKKLLSRLALPFECMVPAIDETAMANEVPGELVRRLAEKKAAVISEQHPQAVVIGSDQMAVFDGQVVGKPGTHEAALQQLGGFSGRMVEFLTAVSVQSKQTGFCEHHTDSTRVYFRTLDADEIQRYLNYEKPYDCAGAFKAESLGVILFERIISEDPTALIGLPLIRTADMLRQAGLQFPLIRPSTSS